MSIVIDTKKIDYDTLKPDKRITDFLAFCREVKMRYEGNIRETEEKEAELQDLEHYAELHDGLDIRRGFALYKKLRETRLERRRAKSENELIYPVYAWICDNDKALNTMAAALGNVRKAAEVIDNRKYMTRTDIING